MNTSKKLDDKLNSWNKSIPLIIYGQEGSGKTTLALNILKGYNLIKVVPENIENINIEDYILSSISRNDVLQMFHKSHGKALYIEDFHLFKNNIQTKLINIIKKCKIPIVIVLSKLSRSIELIKKHTLFFELKYTNGELIKIIKNNVHTSLSDKNLTKFIKDCHYNLNTIFLHLNILKNNTDHKEKTEYLTYYLMNNKDYDNYFSIQEYNTIGLNFLTELEKYFKRERINILPTIYENILKGGIVESTMMNDCIYYDLLILYNVIFPHKIIANNRNSKKYLYKYNNYLSKSMICIHQNNIFHDLKDIFNDNTLLKFLKEDNMTLNLKNHLLIKSYIFKRLKYLGTVIHMKINKKLLEKRMIL
tara:strand:- start:2847 stop:3932 length:1086 start_codon:yes stop_codon:yes gene_type:complete